MSSQARSNGSRSVPENAHGTVSGPPELDEFRLPLLRDVVVAMVDVDRVANATMEFHVEELTFDLPVELDPWYEGGLVTSLGASPPTQIVSTTVMPVFHRLRVTLAEEESTGGI